MFRFARAVPMLFSFLSASLFAAGGPAIKFDAETVNCGTVIEGKTDNIRADFIVRNIGTAVLKLESVRPGCGCTVVKYDSLVLPGKSSTIEAHVNITGFHVGAIVKSIIVTSNAKNEPHIKLNVTATIRALIDLSAAILTLNESNVKVPQALYLSSSKADLKVSGVVLNAENSGGGFGWQSNLSLPIPFKFAATDSVRSDGCKVFRLDLYRPSIDKQVSGEIVIQTNHPDKPELTLHGILTK